MQSEVEYYAELYSGFAQRHFSRPAVRAFRKHLVRRILKVTGAGETCRVLSIGCGIGDTELLLARSVGVITGIDPSRLGVEQACRDAARVNVANAEFSQTSFDDVTGQFDVICAVFVLHHLPDHQLEKVPQQVMRLLAPGGVFYSLDPSVRRMSGAVGRVIAPGLMRKYQTEGERELAPEWVEMLFEHAGFKVRADMYDFGSTPLAGLLPGWNFAYRLARWADDCLLRIPIARRFGSNFEIVARRPVT